MHNHMFTTNCYPSIVTTLANSCTYIQSIKPGQLRTTMPMHMFLSSIAFVQNPVNEVFESALPEELQLTVPLSLPNLERIIFCPTYQI